MTQEETQGMQKILRQNHDIFAWAHSDMKGIHPSIASHRLNVFSTTRPVRQRIRRFHPDRQRIIRNEIDKLLEAGFIREVSYPDWLANVVVVPKKEGKWRVCVDYTNLNNACPKDSFPLPRIDQIVDSTSGQGMLSFLDAFSGYHQIPMSPDDEEKTAFITPHGLYCYKVMPFGLKNAGATYQRLMTKIFKPLIGHSVECWQISGIYGQPKRHRSQPGSSQSSHGDTSPRNKKELQRLTGKLVALGRFIARFTDELRPFFLAIRKAGTQGWTDNCQNALERIKHCLMHPPILSSPIPKEKLYMYLAVSEWAISAALFRCPSPKEQKPVYYVSRALADVETRPNQHHESSEQEWWTLRVDGASRSSGSGVGLYYSPQLGNIWSKPSGWDSPRLTMKQNTRPSCPDWTSPLLSVSKLRIYSDSQLVVRHVQKEYEAKDSRMARYLAKVRSTLQQFTEWTIEKIKRADNRHADALAGIAASLPIKEAILLPIHVQANPSVAENSTCNTIEANQTDVKNGRMILQNISGQDFTRRSKQAHKIRVQAARFTLIGGTCTSDPSQGLIFAVLGIQSPWGMDIVGPLPAAPAQKKFLLVATDYFSKWVEAEAYASIKDKDVTKFVWKNIVCRFGIPQIIIADNGPQFDSIAFRNFCSELNIRNSYSTPLSSKQWPGGSHKQNSNQCLKEKAEQAKGNGSPTIRTDAAKQKDANTELGRNLDWADEVRESASIRMADYQQRASAHYNRKVRPRNFKNGTLVLRKVFENTAEVGAGKFQANWEGPYIVSKANENGAYHLQKLDGTPLLRPWNQTPVQVPLFAHPDAAASLPSVSFHSKLLSGVDSIHPLAGLPHPPPHEGGPQLILLDPLPQPTPPGGLHFPLAGG
ncbi:Transposon Ty3-I Gag-Pol polyprotein [Vitis vinifera]|uniref:Transposon Ty3-I Gag-Pol polyprotein n=1 Tax=Vitis vinifera TaxID=29760 RepID=A0A438GF35_VITVI|nr:Transposon Ty3-I Gag-Pol polyprotein [Vitis vinifera]